MSENTMSDAKVLLATALSGGQIETGPAAEDTATTGRGFSFETITGLSEVIQAYARELEAREAKLGTFGEVISSRRLAHKGGKAYSRLNGIQPIFALVGHEDLQTLYGRLMTLADATFSNRQQCAAFKDLLRSTFWFQWVPNLDCDEPNCGAPA